MRPNTSDESKNESSDPSNTNDDLPDDVAGSAAVLLAQCPVFLFAQDPDSHDQLEHCPNQKPNF